MIWPRDACERGIADAAAELRDAETHWRSEKEIADAIILKAGYRLSRATTVYSEFRKLLAEFGEVPEAFPEVEATEVAVVRPVRFVATEPQWSPAKQSAIDAQRARLILESTPAEPKRYLSFETGCFAREQPLFSL